LTSSAKRRLYASFFFAWLAALLALTYWPDLSAAKEPDKGFRTDYLGHFGFYAALVLFFLLWQRGRPGKLNTQVLIMAGLGGIALGAVTEVTQLFIPGRSLNPVDMLFNCLGVLAGTAVFAVVWRGREDGKTGGR
jgi:VanZ family protein